MVSVSSRSSPSSDIFLYISWFRTFFIIFQHRNIFMMLPSSTLPCLLFDTFRYTADKKTNKYRSLNSVFPKFSINLQGLILLQLAIVSFLHPSIYLITEKAAGMGLHSLASLVFTSSNTPSYSSFTPPFHAQQNNLFEHGHSI